MKCVPGMSGLLGLLVGGAALVHAEDLTLTTYYPSPRGVYRQVLVTDAMAVEAAAPTQDNPGSNNYLFIGSATKNYFNPMAGVCPAGTGVVDLNGDETIENGECQEALLSVLEEGGAPRRNTLVLSPLKPNTIVVPQNLTANQPGMPLAISAGRAAGGATNRAGGDLLLSAGGSTGNQGSTIAFATAAPGAPGTGGRSPATRMTITGPGNVGIGTTNPYSRLEVVSQDATSGLSLFTAQYDGSRQWGTRAYKADVGFGVPLKIETQQQGNWYSSVEIDHGQDDAHPSLKTYYATQLAVAGGNVGIGTTAPLNTAPPVPNGLPGNLDVNDVWVRSANGGAGRWASQGPLLSTPFQATFNDPVKRLGRHTFCALTSYTSLDNGSATGKDGCTLTLDNSGWTLTLIMSEVANESLCEARCLDF